MPISHNDHPTLQDTLGFDASVKRLATSIRECKPPKSFGINGQWGCGKTSFLGLLYDELTGNPPPFVKIERRPKDSDYLVVWFEAWRYQNEPQPIVALLHEIRNQLSWGTHARDYLKKAATIQNALTILSSVIDSIQIAGVGIKLDSLRELAKALPTASEKLPSHTVRQMLEKAIADLLGSHKKLVIFIDDLDRCNPEVAFRLLEGLKIYLSLDNAVYVIAMDQRQLERAIAQALGESGHLAQEYFEKICQDVHHLALLNHGERAAYFKDLLGFQNKDLQRDDFIATVGKTVEETRLLPPNPRRIKAFVNTLGRFEERLGLPENARNTQLFLLMAGLYHFHHRVYESILEHPRFHATCLLPYALGQVIDHYAFGPLVQTLKAGGDARTPTPGESQQQAFYDPQGSNVLRLAGLIQQIGSATHDELLAYSLEHARGG